uniref:Glycosyltransferase n=1 Tax=Cannabis sativa TaxID=3483 RepID=A0A803QIL0_CANSA
MDQNSSHEKEGYSTESKPHAVCIPYPSQSHIKAMLKFAKLLHSKGFYITFVNTEFNHNRFLKNSSTFSSMPNFRFEAIPDGLPVSDQAQDATQDILSLSDSTRKNFLGPFLELLKKLANQTKSNSSKDDVPPRVSCIISDGVMSFAIKAAKQLRLPVVLLFTVAACTVMGLANYRPLLDKGIVPLKDENDLNNFLDTSMEWIPGIKGLRFRDLPTFCRITDSNDIMFNWMIEAIEMASEASAVVIQTFESLEKHVLDVLSSTTFSLPKIYPIGPLQPLLDHIPQHSLHTVPYSLWKEETECIKWLSTQKPNSVIYVNFGSITVLTEQEVIEIGWGLANSNVPFLWVIRPDLIVGEAKLPSEIVDQTKERSLIISWAPQEDVLSHPSTGGFLTHCGWNSVIESLTSGVPMICYPYFADQQTNCWFACNEWGVAMEIESDVKRDQVTKLVKELLKGEKGKQMKSKAMEFKKLIREATAPSGSSSTKLDDLVNQLCLHQID